MKCARENIDKDQDIWNIVLWTDESENELFGHQNRGHVWHELSIHYITAFQENNLMPTVKHGGGSVMVWGCFAAARPGQLTTIESTMNTTVSQRVLKKHVRPSVKKGLAET